MKQLELHRSPARARLIEMERVRGGKVCTKCGKWKPREDFNRKRAVKSGMQGVCKACQNKADRRYREANREKVREQARRYREANPEKVRERDRRYYEANREKKCEQARLCREANPEKAREKERRYREANPEKRRELYRRHREGLLKGGPAHGLPWLAGEDDLIIAGEYGTAVEIAAILGRSEVAIENRRRLLRKKGLIT